MKIVESSFDPILKEEVVWLKNLRKETGQDIGVLVKKEGSLDQQTREMLVKNALRPYRHLHVMTSGKADTEFPDFDEKEKEAREGMYRFIACGAQGIVLKKGLYLEETVNAMCNAHRAIHSHGVAETCVHLAHVHHMDESTAYRMGMLHDITKKMPDEEGRKIIAVWKPEWLSISPKVWHSYTAVIWMKQNMGLYDSRILHAVEHHTLGDGKSDWDAVLYISDKIEPNRGYDSTREMKCSEKNLQAGAAMVLQESRQYILEKEGKHV